MRDDCATEAHQIHQNVTLIVPLLVSGVFENWINVPDEHGNAGIIFLHEGIVHGLQRVMVPEEGKPTREQQVGRERGWADLGQHSSVYPKNTRVWADSFTQDMRNQFL